MGVGSRHDGGAGGGGRDAGGGRGDGAGDDAGALLRARLRRADEQIETPPGLWDRIREPGIEPAPSAVTLPRRWPYAVVLTVAAAVAAVLLGVWWLVRPGPESLRPAGPLRTVKITVYNSERACRTGRSLECALRLARDPRTAYAARGNAAGRVWHGDEVAARCVVTDGLMVRDEEGVTSTRWYLVTSGQGVRGWLPGVRTRNTREVPEC
ncbi:hypothetical protein OIU91_25090 [Streptomyces sp. NBC_01456]|uniref:hypothetical protein n=1 Tax=unclassified Streptomyces TaxID=2593676 RepID=UPI002E349DE0|nr:MULTISPECIES: hypothetical protein [unclassified Streptomyces]